MRYVFVVGALLAGLLVAGQTQAARTEAGRLVSGGQLGLAFLTHDAAEHDTESLTLTYRAGYFMVNNLAVEGRFGLGLSNEQRDEPASDDSMSLDRLFGIYLAGYLPIRADASFYTAVGYSDIRVVDSTVADGGALRSNGLSLGIGAEVIARDGFRFSVEYMRYLHNNELSASVLSVGGLFTF